MSTLILLWLLFGFISWFITCWAYHNSEANTINTTKWHYMLYSGFFIVAIIAGPLWLVSLMLTGKAEREITELKAKEKIDNDIWN